MWSPDSLRQHNFPINHGLEDKSLQLECTACHGSNYIEYTCYNCHDHQQPAILQSHQDAGIQSADIPSCAKCHPAGTVDKTKLAP
jgi:hypothetical protein